MNTIHLHNLLPHVFASRTDVGGDVWLRELTFERGQNYLIAADSGTGKSSLCSFIIGHRNDYTGTIFFDGREAKSLSFRQWAALRRSTLSLLWQDLRLFPELTALENVRLKNQLTHHKPASAINTMFDELHIADKLHTPLGLLSYGQQQRVAFIRALCQPFSFILLDEPVSHVDPTNAQAMAQLLLQEAKAQGAAIITTSIGKELPIPFHQVLHL